MFGMGNHQAIATDKLPVFVHAMNSNEAFQMTQKLWHENGRALRPDEVNKKEFIVFTYEKPACTIWLQRDKDRTDMMEVVLMWNDKVGATEVYAIAPEADHGKKGDDGRAVLMLQAMLTTPSVVAAK